MAGPSEELRALSAAVLAVAQHLSVQEVLQRIVRSARSLLGAEYAALGVPDEADSFAEFVVDGVSDAQWRAIGPLPRQHGVLGAMLREARPQRLDDIRRSPNFQGWPWAHPQMSAFLGMPILAGDRILGAMYLANKEGGFTAEDEELLGVLAAHAAIALTNARLYERSRELTLAEERTRLAGELHDAVAQKLFSLRLSVGAADALLERHPARARAELVRVQQLAAEAIGELRSAIFQLRPAALGDDGLAETLGKHLEVLQRVHGTPIAWRAADVPALAASTEDVVFRVAQEAVHNTLRHAAAAAIEVTLCGDGDRVVLRVRDDGVGFDVRATQATTRRLGLSSMRARAVTVGGTLTVTSEPGAGATVCLEVPGG